MRKYGMPTQQIRYRNQIHSKVQSLFVEITDIMISIAFHNSLLLSYENRKTTISLSGCVTLN